MKSGFDMFSDAEIDALYKKDLRIKDDEDDPETNMGELLSSTFKKQDWYFKDFVEELEKQIGEGKTFDELAEIFWV